MHYNTGPNMDGNYFRDTTQTSGAPGSTLMGEFMTAITKEFETILGKSGDSFYGDYGTDQFNQLAKTIFESSVIGNDAMADNAIDTNQLAPGAVTQSKIEDYSISEAKIQSTAVTQSKIQDGAVVLSKLDDTSVFTKFSQVLETDITTNGVVSALTWTHGLPVGTWVRLSGVLRFFPDSTPEAYGISVKNGTTTLLVEADAYAAQVWRSFTSPVQIVSTSDITVEVSDLSTGVLNNLGMTYEVIPTSQTAP